MSMNVFLQPRTAPGESGRLSPPVRHAARSRSHSGYGLWLALREVGMVILAILSYFLVRGLVDADPMQAISHARELVSFERRLGIFYEPALQSIVLEHRWMVDLANGFYVYGHWPLIAITLGWLFLKHRPAFHDVRLAMVLSGLVGFACFFLFPMAPPRFLPDLGFVDTVVLHSDAYRVLQPPSMTNQYAAMPSLHVGWNLLMGIAIFRHASSRWLRAFGIVMPIGMWATTVVTGNHFAVDGIAGALLVLLVLTAIGWWKRPGSGPHPRFMA